MGKPVVMTQNVQRYIYYYNYNEKQTHTGCVCNPLIYMIYTNINVPKI